MLPPPDCSPACAVTLHSFNTICGDTIDTIVGAGSDFAQQIHGFEESCLASADPHAFLEAIMDADCSHSSGIIMGPPPPPPERPPPPPPPPRVSCAGFSCSESVRELAPNPEAVFCDDLTGCNGEACCTVCAGSLPCTLIVDSDMTSGACSLDYIDGTCTHATTCMHLCFRFCTTDRLRA